jgi:hypothetical protein
VFLIMLETGRFFDRITLGALILALGLLVDDAIIAIEVMVVKMEEGMDRIKAAVNRRWTGTPDRHPKRAPAVVTGLDDVAVVSQTVEQRGGHRRIAEHAGPFAEGQIGGDEDGGALIKPADEVEEKLTAGLGKGQISELVQDNEVHPGQVLGKPALSPVAGLGLEAVDEIDHVVEAAPSAGPDAASRDGNGQVGFAGAGATDQHDVALLGDEATAGEIVDKRLVDRRAFELEVGEVLGQRQLGDGELVLDRTGLLLVDLGGEQIADDVLGFVLAFDGGRHDLVEGGLHAVELKLAHEIEDLGSFHQFVLRRLS